jgi:hypothetical protein
LLTKQFYIKLFVYNTVVLGGGQLAVAGRKKINPAHRLGIGFDMPKRPIQKSTVHGGTADTSADASFNQDQESVARLAYQLWAERGRPEGSPEKDWFQAQELLRAGEAVIASSTLL